MFPYHAHCKKWLNGIKEEGRYRSFIELERLSTHPPYAIWHDQGEEKEVIIWCTNDYLSMGYHPSVVEAFQKTAASCGVGSGGTRNISGNTRYHVALEKTMADLHKQEKALIFSSGYIANECALYTIGTLIPDLTFLSDERNHASIVSGIRQSGATKKVFNHNDTQHLEQLLKEIPLSSPKAIVCESVYSMDGDFASLRSICELAQKYGALLIVDEVHAMGIYGREGEGIVGALDLEVDLIIGNFAKGYGCIGGYIAGSHVLVDIIRSAAPGFIFTTSLPPSFAAASLASVSHLRKDRSRSQKLLQNAAYLKHQLANTLVNYVDTQSHIIPVMVQDAFLCQELAKTLLQKHAIYVQPINYPTVPRGKERFRITVTPDHTKEHIDVFAEAFSKLWDYYAPPREAVA